MARKPIDLTGRIYGKLTVLEEVEKHHKEKYWLCKCACGNYTKVRGAYLKSGNKTTCGCERKTRGDSLIDPLTGKPSNDKTKASMWTSIKGIYFHKSTNEWDVCIMINKKRKYLGRFSTLKEAVEKRNEAVEKYKKQPYEDGYTS